MWSPVSHLEAVNLADAFNCYNEEMIKCCEERLEELNQVAVSLGSQPTLMAAYDALRERWEETAAMASSISDDLHQKSQRWSVVEPLISEIDQKLTKTANYIQNNRGDKTFDAPIDKQLESELDASNTIRDNLMELEHLVLPLGHQGGYFTYFRHFTSFCFR